MQQLRAVGEREERVARRDRAAECLLAVEAPGLLHGLGAGIDARRLTAAEADLHAVPHEDDRVRDDGPDDAPCEVEVRALTIRGLASAHDLPRGRVVLERVRSRDEDGAARRTKTGERIEAGRCDGRRVQGGVDDEAEVRLRGQDLEGAGIERGRDDDLEEELREGRGDVPVDRAAQRDHAAER